MGPGDSGLQSPVVPLGPVAYAAGAILHRAEIQEFVMDTLTKDCVNALKAVSAELHDKSETGLAEKLDLVIAELDGCIEEDEAGKMAHIHNVLKLLAAFLDYASLVKWFIDRLM